MDELLLRVADEMDAGRPVAGLVADAALRTQGPVNLGMRRPRTYQVTAVHWLLGQLCRCDDDLERAGLEADPWRDLAPWDSSCRPANAWTAADGLPGTRMHWAQTGVLVGELRDERGQVSASVRGRLSLRPSQSGQAGVVRVGGRDFTSRGVSRAASSYTAATFGSGFPAAGELGEGGRDRLARVLADPFGLPVLLAGGRQYDYRDGAYIRLAGGRWLQFPVRGLSRGNAIMTALNQDGDKVALYRTAVAEGTRELPQVEITVHPDQRITDELLLVLAVSADWLWSYFRRPGDAAP